MVFLEPPLMDEKLAWSIELVAPPAIVNAVVAALSPFGVHHVDIPLTAEKIWRAIRGAHGPGMSFAPLERSSGVVVRHPRHDPYLKVAPLAPRGRALALGRGCDGEARRTWPFPVSEMEFRNGCSADRGVCCG